MGPRDGLKVCGNSRPHPNSIPGPPRPSRITIPTELSRQPKNHLYPAYLLLHIYCLINIQNTNYSLSAAQIYCELSVSTALSTCCHSLTCINISLDSCLLAKDRIQLLVINSVDVRLQYFMPYSISVNFYLFLLSQYFF